VVGVFVTAYIFIYLFIYLLFFDLFMAFIRLGQKPNYINKIYILINKFLLYVVNTLGQVSITTRLWGG